MGVPKRKASKARKNQRRAEWRKIASPAIVVCPQCHELKQPHRVCPKCGYYKDKEVINAE